MDKYQGYAVQRLRDAIAVCVRGRLPGTRGVGTQIAEELPEFRTSIIRLARSASFPWVSA